MDFHIHLMHENALLILFLVFPCIRSIQVFTRQLKLGFGRQHILVQRAGSGVRQPDSEHWLQLLHESTRGF